MHRRRNPVESTRRSTLIQSPIHTHTHTWICACLPGGATKLTCNMVYKLKICQRRDKKKINNAKWNRNLGNMQSNSTTLAMEKLPTYIDYKMENVKGLQLQQLNSLVVYFLRFQPACRKPIRATESCQTKQMKTDRNNVSSCLLHIRSVFIHHVSHSVLPKLGYFSWNIINATLHNNKCILQPLKLCHISALFRSVLLCMLLLFGK